MAMSALTHLLLFLCLVLWFSAPAHSSALPVQDISPLLRQAELKQLAKHPYWLALVHYKKSTSGAFNVESEVVSPDFFLSTIGSHNPQAELSATLQAFFLPRTDNLDEHPQCRFIARFHWLKENLDWTGLTPPDVQCKAFQSWSNIEDIKSLSLVFATGYLSSPASFYGHILLKVNSLDDTAQIDLLNQSVNYGAIVPENELPLVYVYRGLFGGYEAGFSHDVFYRHNHNYAENELRDLWEYELNLSKEQVANILFHTWELLGRKFTYYFLDKNCAYHMAGLIDLVVEDDINYDQDIFSVPITLFNRLDSISNLGQPIIKSVKYIPSRQSRFINGVNTLDSSQQALLFRIVSRDEPIEATLPALMDTDKIGIIDTLIDYYEFRSVSDEDKTYAKRKRRELLLARTRLPANDTRNDSTQPQKPPTRGPLPAMFQLGWENNDIIGAGISLDGRLSYYDLISLEYGRPSNSQLSAFEIKFSAHHDELFFRNFDVFNVLNLNVSKTGLPGDGGMAWKVRVFIENQDLPCNYCGDTNFTGGIGKGTYLARETVLYAMTDINLSVASAHDSTLTLEPYIGILGSPMPQWKTSLTLGYQYDINNDHATQRHIVWNNRFGTARDWDIRINYRQLDYKEITTLFSLYW